MQADTAWDEALRLRMFPHTTLSGRANLYVMPNLDAANIAYNIVRVMTDGVSIGPILMGVNRSAHILTPASTVRRIVNMTAVAAVDAQIRAAQGSGSWASPWPRRRHRRTTRSSATGRWRRSPPPCARPAAWPPTRWE